MWWKWALVLAASVGMLQLGVCFSGARRAFKLVPGALMALGSIGCGIWYLITDQPGAKLVAGIAALVLLALVGICALGFLAHRILLALFGKFFDSDKE